MESKLAAAMRPKCAQNLRECSTAQPLAQLDTDRGPRRLAQLPTDEPVEPLWIGLDPIGGLAFVPGLVVSGIFGGNDADAMRPRYLRQLRHGRLEILTLVARDVE